MSLLTLLKPVSSQPTPVSINTQSGVAQTMAVNMPGTIVAGELLIILLTHTGVMQAPPAGWLLKIDENNNAVYYRWATGTEDPSYTFSTSATFAINNVAVAQVAGSLGSGDPFDFAVSGNSGFVLPSPSLSDTTTVANTYQIYYDNKSITRTMVTAPTNMSLKTANTALAHYFDTKQGSAGATGSKSALFDGTALHGATFLAIKPASANLDKTKTGSALINAMKVGSETVSKLYVGSTQVWP